MNYFPTVNPVHRVHVSVDRPGVLGPPWTNVGADRGHGGVLTGAWPQVAPGAKARRWGRKTELEQRCGGRATVVQNGEAAALGERKARAWREAKRGWERCDELWGRCSPFIGGRGRGGRELIAGVNGFNTIEGVKAH
jgi:hypothetical protein